MELYKKFSLAVSFGLIKTEELENIIIKYSNYIHDIYFSPTESLKYQTRRNVYDFDNTNNDERRNSLSRIISTARAYDIKTSMTLNSSMINIDEALLALEEYYNIYKFDYLTTTLPIAKRVKSIYPDLNIICSYNEGVVSYDKLKDIINSGVFFAVVLGNKYIRDPYAFGLLRNAGIKAILMLNTGCVIGCTSFCNNGDDIDYCKRLFNSALSKIDINKMYATQSVFPEELKEYDLHNIQIDVFKLASRPIAANELKLLLDSYTAEESYSYIQNSIYNYHLYARLAHYVQHYTQLNYNKILSIKQELWNNIEL